MVRIETLSFVIQPPRILLGYKRSKKKFGGKWNGWGGGVKNGETVSQANAREVNEEGNNIKLVNPIEKGVVLFKFIDDPEEYDHEVHILTAQNYLGQLKPTKDFLGYAWFHKDTLPDQMMPADKKYLMPPIFKEGNFDGEIHFDKNWKVVFAKINSVRKSM